MIRRWLHVGKEWLLVLICAASILCGFQIAIADQIDLKRISVFTGSCRMQIVSGFFPCKSKVAWMEFGNGRAILMFTKDDVTFTASGSRDRQPNLEDYYMGIDTVRILKGKEQTEDNGMEGECHFKLNRDATKFYFIKCDVYNRAKGSSYNFYLEKISTFTKEEPKFSNSSPETLSVPQTQAPSAETPVEIPLEDQGGTFVVPVVINDEIRLKFTVDSGAADVSIPADVVSTLMRTGSLLATDFTGEQKYRLADGSVVPSQTFTIRTLKVGNQVLKGVKASVASVNGDLLLGQSFLGRFNSWSIDNTKHVLLLK